VTQRDLQREYVATESGGEPAPRTLGPEILGLAFVGVAMLTALLTPEDAYERYEWLRAFADGVARHFNVINEMAAASHFPGATRVVLALLWTLTVPAAVFIWWHPGMLGRDGEALRRMRIVGRLPWVGLLALLVGILPNSYTLDGSTDFSVFMQFVGASRLALGSIAGVYCALVAFVLSIVARVIDPRLSVHAPKE